MSSLKCLSATFAVSCEMSFNVSFICEVKEHFSFTKKKPQKIINNKKDLVVKEAHMLICAHFPLPQLYFRDLFLRTTLALVSATIPSLKITLKTPSFGNSSK